MKARTAIALPAAAAVAVATMLAGGASGVLGVGAPAQIVAIAPETALQQHEVTDYGSSDTTGDDRVGTTQWRVVKDTGNCCENHLASTKEGRLFDIGGSYINYTDDRGLTWQSVRPLAPLVNGEGSMAVAPNGDVLGIEWDAYSGDHLIAYKYNAASGKWFTLDNPLHHPVYDRPWITIVPGPFAIGIGADTVPYIAFVQGGTGVKDPMFVSTDGLSYAEASSLTVDGQSDTPIQQWFPISADASFDWIQPIKRSPVTGLGAGKAIASGGWLLDPADRKWDSWRLPGGATPPTFVQIDSAGRIHHVRGVAGGLEYRISTDNGQTWTSSVAPVAFGGLTDFKANRAVGIAAVATRAGNQDWVYKFDITGDTARLVRKYRLGLGDTTSIAGLTVPPTAPRMDFQTIAILPDGRVAASFLDSSTFSHPPGTGTLGRITPAVAIELDTTLPPLKPDLDPGPLTALVVQSKPDVLSFRVPVVNTAFGDASEVVVRFLVDGKLLGPDRTIGSVPAGETAIVTSAPWSAKKQDGQHTLQVLVDPDGAIDETDEANNAASMTFTIKGGRLR